MNTARNTFARRASTAATLTATPAPSTTPTHTGLVAPLLGLAEEIISATTPGGRYVTLPAAARTSCRPAQRRSDT